MEIGSRIKQIRKDADLTQGEFGARIGISLSGVSSLEVGKNTPSEQTIRAICSEFNVNRDWLVDGIGAMEASRPFVPELMRILRQHPALKTVLESMVDEMDAEDWAALNHIARKFVDQKNKKETE